MLSITRFLTAIGTAALLTAEVSANANALPWANANPQAKAAAAAYAEAYGEAEAIGHADPDAYAMAASADDCASIGCHAACGLLIMEAQKCAANNGYTGPYDKECLCASNSPFNKQYGPCMNCGWTLWKYYGGYVKEALEACETLSTEPTGTLRCSTTLTDSYTIDTNIQGCEYLGNCPTTSSTTKSSIETTSSETQSSIETISSQTQSSEELTSSTQSSLESSSSQIPSTIESSSGTKQTSEAFSATMVTVESDLSLTHTYSPGGESTDCTTTTGHFATASNNPIDMDFGAWIEIKQYNRSYTESISYFYFNFTEDQTKVTDIKFLTGTSFAKADLMPPSEVTVNLKQGVIGYFSTHDKNPSASNGVLLITYDGTKYLYSYSCDPDRLTLKKMGSHLPKGTFDYCFATNYWGVFYDPFCSHATEEKVSVIKFRPDQGSEPESSEPITTSSSEAQASSVVSSSSESQEAESSESSIVSSSSAQASESTSEIESSSSSSTESSIETTSSETQSSEELSSSTQSKAESTTSESQGTSSTSSNSEESTSPPDQCTVPMSCHISCGGAARNARQCSSSGEYTGPFDEACLCSAGSGFNKVINACLDCGWALWKDYGEFLSPALSACSTLPTEPTGTLCKPEQTSIGSSSESSVVSSSSSAPISESTSESGASSSSSTDSSETTVSSSGADTSSSSDAITSSTSDAITSSTSDSEASSSAAVEPTLSGSVENGAPVFTLSVPGALGPWTELTLEASKEGSFVYEDAQLSLNGQVVSEASVNVTDDKVSVIFTSDVGVDDVVSIRYTGQFTGAGAVSSQASLSLNLPDVSPMLVKREVKSWDLESTISADENPFNASDSSSSSQDVSSDASSGATSSSSDATGSSSQDVSSGASSDATSSSSDATGSSSQDVSSGATSSSESISSDASSGATSSSSDATGSSESISSDASSGYSNTTSFSTSTTTEKHDSTTVVTITSCEEDKCHETAVTTGLTVVTETISGTVTEYTTYCPIETESSTITKTKEHHSTTVVTITSCEEDKCHETAVTTGLTVVTKTISGTVTEYTTYCPIETTTVVPETTVITVTSCYEEKCETKKVTTGLTTVTTVEGTITTTYTTYCPTETAEGEKDRTTTKKVTSTVNGETITHETTEVVGESKTHGPGAKATTEVVGESKTHGPGAKATTEVVGESKTHGPGAKATTEVVGESKTGAPGAKATTSVSQQGSTSTVPSVSTFAGSAKRLAVGSSFAAFILSFVILV